MSDGGQVRKQRPKSEETDVEEPAKADSVDTSDVDDLLDEIDEVLDAVVAPV